jgi:secreted Zn-dependent insulinase-like peptidase
MLFLGTETYPDEGEYHRFIGSQAGHTNAFTNFEKTCFTFTIGAGHLRDALHRFASFFICPTFNLESIKREVSDFSHVFISNFEMRFLLDRLEFFHVVLFMYFAGKETFV